jgi:hypothetical protein
MDWNWFFSSLAQSSAAVVGIFCAFIFTKIINNQTEFGRKRARIAELERQATRLVEEAENRYFNWYNNRTERMELDSLRGLLEREELAEFSEPAHYYDELAFSPYQLRQEVEETIRQVIEAEPARRSRPTRPIPEIPLHAMVPNLQMQLQAEREAIDHLLVEVREHIRAIEDHLASLRSNPESSPLIAFSIPASLALFYLGVIYPLSFLPVLPGAPIVISISAVQPFIKSIQGVVLSGISVIFTVVMAVFFVINLRLRFRREEIDRLTVFTQLSRYSPHFDAFERNTRRSANPDKAN